MGGPAKGVPWSRAAGQQLIHGAVGSRINHMINFFSLAPDDALIVADVQNDFLPGGALAVSGGEQVMPVLNEYLRRFDRQALPVFASRDWHPRGHCSFRETGGPWPVHCVADSHGAAFAAELALPAGTRIISKATAIDKEAYSAFAGTDLAEQLRRSAVRRVFVGGLTTDYCVLGTSGMRLCLGLPLSCYVMRFAPLTRNPEMATRPLRKCFTSAPWSAVSTRCATSPGSGRPTSGALDRCRRERIAPGGSTPRHRPASTRRHRVARPAARPAGGCRWPCRPYAGCAWPRRRRAWCASLVRRVRAVAGNHLERLPGAQLGLEAVQQVEQLRIDHADVAGIVVAQEMVQRAQRLGHILLAHGVDQGQLLACVGVVQRQAAHVG